MPDAAIEVTPFIFKVGARPASGSISPSTHGMAVRPTATHSLSLLEPRAQAIVNTIGTTQFLCDAYTVY